MPMVRRNANRPSSAALTDIATSCDAAPYTSGVFSRNDGRASMARRAVSQHLVCAYRAWSMPRRVLRSRCLGAESKIRWIRCESSQPGHISHAGGTGRPHSLHRSTIFLCLYLLLLFLLLVCLDYVRPIAGRSARAFAEQVLSFERPLSTSDDS